MTCLREIPLPPPPVKDCDILEFFVWQTAQHPVPLSAHLVAQKFTFQEARITDRYDIFVCWYDRRYSISHHPWNDCKEVKLTHPHIWGLPFSEIFAGIKWYFYFVSSPPPSLIHKRIWHSGPDKMVILRFWPTIFLVSWLRNKVPSLS